MWYVHGAKPHSVAMRLVWRKRMLQTIVAIAVVSVESEDRHRKDIVDDLPTRANLL